MEDTLKFSGDMEKSSQSRKDYVEFHAERPIIKKLQDNSPVHPTNGAYYAGEIRQTLDRFAAATAQAISFRTAGGILRLVAKVSPVSHTGPTTS